MVGGLRDEGFGGLQDNYVRQGRSILAQSGLHVGCKDGDIEEVLCAVESQVEQVERGRRRHRGGGVGGVGGNGGYGR